jgi:hypothetical protein
MLGRKDMEHERWTVRDCLPVRGEPCTDLANRVMFAPSTDGEMERVVRGHEMMHAKVSPTPEQMTQWVGRSIASETAMIVVEELRVNYLCQTAGFDVKKFLSDGSELATGEHLAKSNDWAGAVAMCIATANTAGHKTFLNGIRRHNREWGEALVTIGKRAVKEMRKSHSGRTLASTDTYEGIAPYGFTHSERLAEWVDRLATFPPPPKKPSPKGKAGEAKGVDSPKAKAKRNTAPSTRNPKRVTKMETHMAKSLLHLLVAHTVGLNLLSVVNQCHATTTAQWARSVLLRTWGADHADCTAT